MTKNTWMILGATSIIANEFAHLAAAAGHPLLLVGRDTLQLDVIADDISLRHRVACDVLTADLSEDIRELLKKIQTMEQGLSLFIAHSATVENNHLNPAAISKLVKTNILSTVQVIHTYLNKQQSEHQLLFLSSVAACRGRARNSLYGASKAAIEVYLQGLQQQAGPSTTITVARLGFIDTVQTYGMPGVFYASPPKACAKACWDNLHRKKRRFYHPGFWRLIMAVIKHLPFFIYRRMGNI
ncbi:KR domain-containing protein [Legionella taurinensis]|uniref:KR domain-containing protein n=1 Tax=Legionella taurinensis TaxID=70611 RepID=A0A3A5LC78_9GAMM|nr:SDR family NAD(P)-dependent oxidoreductase [Legionella taurinensis]MDX1837369.1 SDR family NAD(P)-dependent oxidoreductase [Legionella taurinensis]PUT40723.1 short-chain dehydrogenase [Legionella taurinensis]PUT44145.1 short-chain dehydrogenase [Legionella taurinensis]PUT47446.1 short-chain dehydrogenase [Legionella taurinensis]PUT48585.1 short-chain dehydrogenase [Legionella taurinensis]